jgi:hypothetical protein
VAKLLSDDQKQQHVEKCTEFIDIIHHPSLAMLDSTVTMDETKVCYHTPRTKKSTSSG